MSIRDVAKDERNSIKDEIVGIIDDHKFSALASHLGRYEFWSSSGKMKPLWEHQRGAIETAAAYLIADPHLPERRLLREAALLKLPTGTGKSGIIAVLSRCLPQVTRTLILTPRQTLVAQMKDDVRFRFWKHLGYDVTDGTTFTAVAATIGTELGGAYVETLLPSTIGLILQHVPAAERTVLVGTYQALDMIRRQSKDTRMTSTADRKAANDTLGLLASFDLILVDEGHYEPAISWSKGVRDLNRPTILLSATPYRNDFKSFRVRGRFVFNYPHHDAVQKHIIREVAITPAQSAGEGPASKQFVDALAKLVPRLKKQAAAWTKRPKVMIRADDLDTLQDLQGLIDAEFGTKSVLIHDRAAPTKKHPRRFDNVRRAFREAADAEFWLHQFKLMEGVDDSDFIAVAIFDLPTNGRQLVQQIGRIVRTSPGRIRRQTAWVIATPNNARRIEATWERYRKYEDYAAKNTRHIVVNEIALPDRVLEIMPESQYVGREFRQRFDSAAALSADDLQLSTSSAVFEWAVAKRAISDLAESFEDAIMEEDRFRIVPLGGLPNNCVGFTYYAWRNSPLLVDKFFSEWKLGVFIAVQHGNLVLVHDSEGIVLEPEALGLKTASRTLMERAFPEPAGQRTSRLTRMSFGSLDMAEQAIRTMAMRTRSFETTFTDLLDPNLVPTAAAGFVGGKGRYIGFATARFRDSNERRVSMVEFIAWTRTVARELATAKQPSSVFGRYALIRDNVTQAGAQPKTILLNLSRDELLEDTPFNAEVRTLAADPDIDYDDLCADIAADGTFLIHVLGKDVECKVTYAPETGRYRFESEQLNELFRRRDTSDRAHTQTPSQRITAQQSFRIMVAEPKIVYAEKRFFEPRIALAQPDGSIPVLDEVYAIPRLANAKSEKGEAFFGDRARWHDESVFGAVESICIETSQARLRSRWGKLGQLLAAYPLVICDDDGKEIADFIGVDSAAKRVLFLHGKANRKGVGRYHVDTLQEVGRQATASLAFLTRTPPPQGWEAARWAGAVQANKVTLAGRNRMFRNIDGLTGQQITDTLRTACGQAATQIGS